MTGEVSLRRRRFLQMAGGASVFSLLRPEEAMFGEQGGQTLRVFTTSDTKKHAEGPAVAWGPGSSGSARAGDGEQVVVDAAERFQPVLGFGSAYTDASCYLLNGMEPEARHKFLEETFSPGRMNLSVGRTSIGASDYSRDVYNYDDVAGDVEMTHFSIAHDEAYILPMLREMRRLNPDLFLLSTPWSPPGWMKTYGSMLGGWMMNKYLGPYALYLSRFLEAYRKAGVAVNAITSQNELETDQAGHMPATYWPPELEADFVRDHLGPMLRKNGEKTEIWLLDHNYDLWKRVRWQMQDAELQKYVSGVAWHGYVGTPDQMSRLHEAEPQLPFYWTEGGPDYTDPKYASDWTRWGLTFSGAINNWCRCVITWNLMLNERGEPNIGPFSCGGLVTLRGDRELVYSGQYWALRQFSEHVRRGAVRVGTHSDASELGHVGFVNKDGSWVLVLTNTGDDRPLAIVNGGLVARVVLEKNSVTTLVW